MLLDLEERHLEKLSQQLREAFAIVGYCSENVADLLGVDADEVVVNTARIGHFLGSKESLRKSSLGALVRSLLFAQPLLATEVRRYRDLQQVFNTLSRLGALDVVGETVIARCSVTPLRGLLFVADRLLLPLGSAANPPVMPPHASTLAALDPIDRMRDEQVLDLGCGSGAVALSLAYRGIEASGMDINPRAVQFAAFNASLNQLECEFSETLTTWTSPIFNRIVFNSPTGPPGDNALGALETPMKLSDALSIATSAAEGLLEGDGIVEVLALVELVDSEVPNLEKMTRIPGSTFSVQDWVRVHCPELTVSPRELANGRLSGRTALVASGLESATLIASLKARGSTELALIRLMLRT